MADHSELQDAFLKYINSVVSLTEEQQRYVLSQSIYRKVRKRQYLLQEGEMSRHVAFVVKGCLRHFRFGNNDTEHILGFAMENQWICDRENAQTHAPSKSNIDALEDCQLLLWTKENFTEFIRTIPAFGEWFMYLLGDAFTASQERVYSTISQTAEEKYYDFMMNQPELFKRVPLHMVANYLGVSRETLSRVRSQFGNKQ